jgi:hypothetical protein
MNKIAEHVILWGGALTALFIGLKRMYKVAKNIDNLVTYTEERKVTDNKIATDLADHMKAVKEYNDKRDKVMSSLTSDIKEITREIRPNGGSSMKDQLTSIARDVAVLQQWKRDIES